MRVGEQHLSSVVTDRASGQLHELSYWTTGELSAAKLETLLDQQHEFQGPFYQVNICYDYPGSMMIPAAGFRQEDAGMLQMALPSAGAASLPVTEYLAEWQVYNVYTVPGDLHELLMAKFPIARFWHAATVDLKTMQAAGTEGCLRADIRQHDFSLVAVRSGRLLLARSFAYSTPEDVIYYLLRTCNQFTLSQDEVNLEISGLVDRQSSLYKELYQYFSQIHFRENGWEANDTTFPSHFFTSLNDLAQCVS